MDKFLTFAPGICVEGIRVRSVPAGYERREDAPWVFVDLKGRNAPKTNVSRTDVEQTPELTHALFRVYSILGNHIQQEFDRLVVNKIGIVEAAEEADFIRTMGLESSGRSNYSEFKRAIAGLRVVALENEQKCLSATQSEIIALDQVWTSDSKLINNIEGGCGSLGINLPAQKIVELLGQELQPPLPQPRLLGASKDTIGKLDIANIKIYPGHRSERIDICWEPEIPNRWISIENSSDEIYSRPPYERIFVTRDKSISVECGNYDVVIWRGWCLILASSIIPELIDALGEGDQFYRWLRVLLKYGEIPPEDQPRLKELLKSSKGQEGINLLPRLILPFERRFGELKGRKNRGEDNEW